MTLGMILQDRDRPVVTAAPATTVNEAVALLADGGIGAVPVLDGDQVVGILSERDLVHALRRHGASVLDWAVDRVMSHPPITAEPGMSLLAGLSLMTRRRFRHLPVVEGGRMIGFVSIGDLVKARIDRIEEEADAMRAYIAS